MNPDPIDHTPLTTMHVHRAVGGDEGSVSWLVERLNPLLIAQAKWRMGEQLCRSHDPADVVQEAWMVLLPRMSSLAPQQGRLTPVLLSYLSATILHKLRNLLRREARRQTPSDSSHLQQVPNSDELSGIVTKIVRRETTDQVHEALQELPEQDSEIIILRGIEQQPTDQVAQLLGINAKAASKRYSRALQRLRERLPESIFAELIDE